MAMSRKTIALQNGDMTFYQFDSLTGFWGRPSMEREVSSPAFGTTVRVCHNEDGNRDSSFVAERDVPTVVCLGGSHTWGAGVDQEARYTDFLAKDTGWRVVNMGHCSLGLDQVCLAVLEKSPRYRPSVIVLEQYPWAIHRILNNYVNGFVKPYFALSPKAELTLRKVPGTARHPLLRKLVGSYYAYRKELREFRGGIDLKRAYDPFADPIFLAWKSRHYKPMYDLAEKILGVIAADCRSRNVHLLVALGAVHQDLVRASDSSLIDYSLPKRRLVEVLERLRVPHVDMTEPMRAARTPDAPVTFDDGHINEKGHRVFAQVLAREIRSQGWLRNP